MGSLISHTITWTLDATLQPYGGNSATCTFAANVSSTFSLPLTNTYAFTSPEVLPHRSVWHFSRGVTTDLEADFTTSYKSAPPVASTDDVVTYTIVAANSGGDVQNVVLSDNPPHTTVFSPSSCTYRRGVSPTQPCGSLDQMWQEDFAAGDRITTTFAVRMTAGSMNWPLINCATLSWGDNQERLCAETVVNPHFAIYLPLTMRNYVPFCAPQLVTEINTGPRPHGVAVDAAGHRAFVAHADGVTVIDTDSYTVITETGTPAGAYNVAYDHDQNRIWVTRMDASRVTVLDGVTYSPLADLPASDGPLDIAYNPTNERVYASSFSGNRVNVYNAIDMEREQTLKDFQEPGQIAVNPITNKIYVVNHVNNAQMTVIDGETHETYRVATGLLDGYGVAVDATRNLIYATSIYEGRLVIIDGETEEGLGKIEFRRSDGRKPPLRFLAVNPDVGPEGHLFLITSSADKGEDQLLLIPNGWPSLGTPVPLDMARYPVEGIAFNPETDRVWVTSVESGVVSVIQDGLPVCSYPF